MILFFEVRAYLESVQSSVLDLLGALILAVVLVLALLFLRQFVVAGLARKPPPTEPPIMPWYVAEALPMVDRIREVWGPQSQHLTALSFAGRSIQSALASGSNAGTFTDDERLGRDQYLNLLSAWAMTGPTTNESIALSRFLLQNFAPGDDTSFVLGLEALRVVVEDGVRVANSLCQAARRSGVVRVAPFVKDQWDNFRDKANRLSEDLTSFHRKISELRGGAIVPYIEAVSTL